MPRHSFHIVLVSERRIIFLIMVYFFRRTLIAGALFFCLSSLSPRLHISPHFSKFKL
nr:MAG TPA: hypothetical protein [Caudoviricetes sp.]